MNNELVYKNRQVIPRWLPFTPSLRALPASAMSVAEPNQVELKNHDQLLLDWRQNRSRSFAIEVVASSHLLGLTAAPEYRDAVDILIRDSSLDQESVLLKELLGNRVDTEHRPFRKLCEESLAGKTKELVHIARLLLRDNVRDSLLWTDLAFYHVLDGQREKADRCLKVAMSLGNANSHVVRASARFQILQNDPERALFTIRSSPQISRNPSLVSSEIAISQAFNLKSKHIKSGQALLLSTDYGSDQLSELSATLSTLEYNSGDAKQGKRLLARALEAPNENTLAQAQFLLRKFNGNLNIDQYIVPRKHEAETWDNYYQQKYADVVIESEKWFYYQPFSSRPAIINSYVNSLIFEADDQSVKILESALKLSPTDFTLNNNLAYSLARLGRTEEARLALGRSKISRSVEENDLAVLKATAGLVNYREGDSVAGSAMYAEAAATFARTGEFSRECRAYFCWATEEARFDKAASDQLMAKAKDKAIRHNVQDIKVKLKLE